MIKWWTYGGNTISGLKFEKRVSLQDKLSQLTWYEIKEDQYVFYQGKKVAEIYQKSNLYKHLLEPNGINYKTLISKKLLPDNAIYVIVKNTLYIIEIKYQEVAWSVDEKLQTCDFKKKQYKRLLASLNFEVEYIYILNDWFKKPEYKDVLAYIHSVGCDYYFNYIPLQRLGLPVEE